MTLGQPRAGLLVGLAVATLAVAACGAFDPTAVPADYPLVACRLDVPGGPTAGPGFEIPPGFVIVEPGTIVLTKDTWSNMIDQGKRCGTQSVRGATAVIELSSLGAEDRIGWVATLARPGRPSAPDPVPPTMTLFRLDQAGPMVVSTQVSEDLEGESAQYTMRGIYGHDLRTGSYLIRIASGSGAVLAEGRFEVVP